MIEHLLMPDSGVWQSSTKRVFSNFLEPWNPLFKGDFVGKSSKYIRCRWSCSGWCGEGVWSLVLSLPPHHHRDPKTSTAGHSSTSPNIQNSSAQCVVISTVHMRKPRLCGR